MIRASRLLCGLLLALTAQAAVRSQSVDTPRIPLCPGLTIVTAVDHRDGDYESIKRISAVTPQRVDLNYSSEFVEAGVVRRVTVRRNVLIADLASASFYVHVFHNKAATTIPGTTAIGTSTAVLRALKTTGDARLGIVEAVGATAPADRRSSPNVYDYEVVDTIRRVGTAAVAVPVVVNGAAVALPAIHARGNYYGDPVDFFFLDDERNPMALRYRIGRDGLTVVKIDTRCETDNATSSAIERSLAETGRADIYTIHFSFNSDRIREESDATLQEIAGILSRHPDWKLSIEGHTDGVASDAYNLTLSQRRADAVKRALVSDNGVAEGRISTGGFGESRPKDTNDTIEGRARNRRVELVRVP